MKQKSKPIVCKICRKHTYIRSIAQHLQSYHAMTAEKYYLQFIGNKTRCKTCGKYSEFINIPKGYRKICKRHTDSMKCKICNKIMHAKSSHLHIEHGISPEKYFLKYIGKQGKCEVCGKPTKFKNMYKGYARFCSLKCVTCGTWKNPKSRKILLKHLHNNAIDPKIRAKISVWSNEIHKDPIANAKRSASMKKTCSTIKYKKKRSKITKIMWQRPKLRKQLLKHLYKLNSKISSFEKKIIKLIEINDLPWRYVGDGKHIIAEKNPDFVHLKKKIVCEAYSDYWKKKNFGITKKYEKERTKIFASKGYQTIFIAQHDSEQDIIRKLQ